MSTTGELQTRRPGSGPVAPSGEGLQSARGNTSIADDVVSKVAEMAAREIRGVHELSGGMSGALRRITPGLDSRGTGASVEVGEREAIVELDLVVDYGVSIPQLADAVRENVIGRVEHTTGLSVKAVNIDVTDLHFVEDERGRHAEDERAHEARVQ